VKSAVPFEVLFEETLVPVCGPGFLASHGRPDAPRDLLGVPLLFPSAVDLGADPIQFAAIIGVNLGMLVHLGLRWNRLWTPSP